MELCRWAGWPLLLRGWCSVVTRNLNMFTLITVGVGAAFLLSTVAMLMPGLQSGAVLP
jgi:Cu+-exporting ATPase